jgi:hypothetical protein
LREVIDEQGNLRGELINLSFVEKYLRLPYFAEAARIELYHSDKLIFKYKIDLCNKNSICEIEKHENYLSCPEDCPSGSKDGYCDKILDGRCDADCLEEMDIDCTCGNKLCDERENEKLCPKDCKLSFWQRIINWIKSLFS